MPTPTKLSARVVEVIHHSDDLRSFLLEPERGLPRFLPGQFLHLALDHWEPALHWPESRVFSIASSPRQRDRIRLTVSRQGAFTRRMFAELGVGRKVWLKMPYGSFCPNPDLPGRTVLMAGGSGVTPFISFLEWAAVERPGARIDLHYGARTPSLLIYREAVERCQRGPLSDLRLCCYAERIPGAESSADLVVGRLSAERAWEGAGEPSLSRFYLSGPKAMIDALRARLLTLGAPDHAVLSDEWA